uniref:Uncharacterized protein n=1 Tax=Rhizophora mucronata TaxID=61149 RepID=A0A2P2K283_RHIMU
MTPMMVVMTTMMMRVGLMMRDPPNDRAGDPSWFVEVNLFISLFHSLSLLLLETRISCFWILCYDRIFYHVMVTS